MYYSVVAEKAGEHVAGLFAMHQQNTLHYHNLSHTKEVVLFTAKAAKHYQLSQYHSFIITIAAWFHDTGRLTGAAENHQVRGAAMAQSFLKQWDPDVQTIAQVKACILVTQSTQQPVNLLQEILCDAVTCDLGCSKYPRKNHLLQKETAACEKTIISKEDWRKKTINNMATHQYQTAYAHDKLNTIKQHNIKSMANKQSKRARHEIAAVVVPPFREERPGNSQKSVADIFKLVSCNNQRLSAQADRKAHIMIQVNAIIVSVLLTLIVRKVEEQAGLVVPTCMLRRQNRG